MTVFPPTISTVSSILPPAPPHAVHVLMSACRLVESRFDPDLSVVEDDPGHSLPRLTVVVAYTPVVVDADLQVSVGVDKDLQLADQFRNFHVCLPLLPNGVESGPDKTVLGFQQFPQARCQLRAVRKLLDHL